MNNESLATFAQIFTAIGTIAISILALWGDKIKAKVAGPKLLLTLRDNEGHLTVRGNQKRTIFYHLKIENNRSWVPSRRTRILVTSIEKRRANDTYFPETLPIPLQLTWAFPEFHSLLPNIATTDFCDIGYLDENDNQFRLSLYVYPNNFTGFIGANESMRIGVIASSDNFESQTPLIIEISWDGKWDSNMPEMQKHLVVNEVT